MLGLSSHEQVRCAFRVLEPLRERRFFGKADRQQLVISPLLNITRCLTDSALDYRLNLTYRATDLPRVVFFTAE